MTLAGLLYTSEKGQERTLVHPRSMVALSAQPLVVLEIFGGPLELGRSKEGGFQSTFARSNLSIANGQDVFVGQFLPDLLNCRMSVWSSKR